MAKYIKDKTICSQKIYTRLKKKKKKKKTLAAKPIARLAYNAVSKDASRWQRYSGAGLYMHFFYLINVLSVSNYQLQPFPIEIAKYVYVSVYHCHYLLWCLLANRSMIWHTLWLAASTQDGSTESERGRCRGWLYCISRGHHTTVLCQGILFIHIVVADDNIILIVIQCVVYLMM